MGYFYANNCEQYIFFRMPKELFSPRFSGLSCEAKVLYGLLLDRMSLSRKKRWMDEESRVYVIFSRQEAMAAICCGKEKVIKLFQELEQYSLIEQRRQGATKCNLIYVLDFHEEELEPEPPPEPQKPSKRSSPAKESSQPAGEKSSMVPTGEVHQKVRSEKPTSLFLSPNEEESEVGKSDLMKSDFPTSIYRYISKTENNDTEIYRSYPGLQQIQRGHGRVERTQRQCYWEQLCENVDYPTLYVMAQEFQDGPQQADELLELVLDALCTTQASLRVGKDNIPAEAVRGRLLKLRAEHICFVLESLRSVKGTIRNFHAYLLTALYRAPATLALHDQAVFSTSFFQQGQQKKAPTWDVP